MDGLALLEGKHLTGPLDRDTDGSSHNSLQIRDNTTYNDG
jgi:hypothetical protein